MPTFNYAQLEGLWVQAGGDPSQAPLMAAIALAESSGNSDSNNTTDNGGKQTSWGLWQISDGTHNNPGNANDPLSNARLAVAKVHSQGLSAWGTYDTGAYKQYMQSGVSPDTTSIPGGMSQADWQALNAASKVPGGTAYLTAMAQAAQSQGSNPASGTPAPAPATPGDTSAQGSAYSQIVTTLNQFGLGDLASWAWTELTGGKNSDQIMIDLQQQPTYKNSIFGQVNDARTAAGLKPMTPSDILTYQDTALQYAQGAGLPAGFMDTKTIVNLLGHDVSPSELDARLTAGYTAAMQAPQETRDLLAQYYGVNTGQLAAYYLDPTKAQSLLQNQLVAAEVGTQAVESGFGQLTKANAEFLTQNLSAQGKVGTSLTTGKWTVDVGPQFATLAPLAALQTPMLGQTGQANATQKQLLEYGFLSKGQPQVEAAVGVRKQAFQGGGGPTVTARGAVGAGYASTEGIQGT